jgi:hypothetical protein
VGGSGVRRIPYHSADDCESGVYSDGAFAIQRPDTTAYYIHNNIFRVSLPHEA